MRRPAGARAETARAAVYASAVTAGSADSAAARLLADAAAVRGARDCRPAHGDMGFTWEADGRLRPKGPGCGPDARAEARSARRSSLADLPTCRPADPPA